MKEGEASSIQNSRQALLVGTSNLEDLTEAQKIIRKNQVSSLALVNTSSLLEIEGVHQRSMKEDDNGEIICYAKKKKMVGSLELSEQTAEVAWQPHR